ncbi:hypothetical protein BCR43DRAFT_518717 [Syncephalastrum racemosum]|uniref:Uncharacterized protein n=1 Tax=Syncephalastrum racemosum TaxID=13706 RepID=A0A1X2H1W4_SYNRA|nr:hypothetical protein BCR43DRAFT_518717 [Syncephalastrum racemosum]
MYNQQHWASSTDDANMMDIDDHPKAKRRKLNLEPDVCIHTTKPSIPTDPDGPTDLNSSAELTNSADGNDNPFNVLAAPATAGYFYGEQNVSNGNEANYASSSAAIPNGVYPAAPDAPAAPAAPAARSPSPMSVSPISPILDAFAPIAAGYHEDSEGYSDGAAYSSDDNADSLDDASGSKKEQHIKGKQKLKEATKNPNVKPCSKCVKEGVYDEKKPHGTRRNKLCPFRYMTYKDIMAGKLNDTKPAQFVRKASLESVLRLGGAEKQGFINEVRKMVDYITELGVKAQAFAHFYLLHTLEQNPDRSVPAILFDQPFFTACIQLTNGSAITSPNALLPANDMTTVFENFYKPGFKLPAKCTVENLAYSGARQYLAREMEVAFRNSISERFERNIKSYFSYALLDDNDETGLTIPEAKRLAQYIYSLFATPDEPIPWPTRIVQTGLLQQRVENLVTEAWQYLPENEHLNIVPITNESLSQYPYHYMPFMYQALRRIEDFNQEQLELANSPQVVVTRSWAYSILRDLPEWSQLGRRYRRRLAKNIQEAVSEGKPYFDMERLSEPSRQRIRDIIHNTRQKIENSRLYLRGNTANLQYDDCFVPDVHQMAQQRPYFSLAPSSHLKRRYSTIDMGMLAALLRHSTPRLYESMCHQAGITTDQHDWKWEHNLKLFAETFDFAAIGFPDMLNTIDDPAPAVMFTGHIQTDGHGVDFILARQRREGEHVKDVTELAVDEAWQNKYEIWGVDPGVTEVFVASNDHNEAPHQIRKMSAAEFYSIAGYKKSSKKMLEAKQGGIIQAETWLSQFRYKTSDPNVLMQYLQQLFELLPQLTGFYREYGPKLRFNNYAGRQRAEAEVLNIFVNGGRKYCTERLQKQRGKLRQRQEQRGVHYDRELAHQAQREKRQRRKWHRKIDWRSRQPPSSASLFSGDTTPYRRIAYPPGGPSAAPQGQPSFFNVPASEDPGPRVAYAPAHFRPVRHPFEQGPQRSKWKKAPFNQSTKRPLIALGNAAFPSTYRGKQTASLAGSLTKMLKRGQRQDLLELVSVDEYLTSQYLQQTVAA